MDMYWPACMIDISPGLFLRTILEHIGNRQVTDREQARTYTSINIASIAAVEEPN